MCRLKECIDKKDEKNTKQFQEICHKIKQVEENLIKWATISHTVFYGGDLTYYCDESAIEICKSLREKVTALEDYFQVKLETSNPQPYKTYYVKKENKFDQDKNDL